MTRQAFSGHGDGGSGGGKVEADDAQDALVGIADFEEAVQRHVRYSIGKQPAQASARDVFMAASLAVRDLLLDRMFETEARYQAAGAKRLYYLSLEFLIGRSLGSNLQTLGILDLCHQALAEFGLDVDEVREAEPDAGLGNGGLGRLAACFLDSLATLDMPGFGYGINYEYGLFRQVDRERPSAREARRLALAGHALADRAARRGRASFRCTAGWSTGPIAWATIAPRGSTGASSWACPTTCRSSATADAR